ncbi:MAG: hypothetical protein KHY83_07755 [Coriobacteriia bacterium]|nr:hypothetical protein [Coriobacteriia bacterium]MBS5478542.1 hypothetical protein [Coriobacteriia bacterium]
MALYLGYSSALEHVLGDSFRERSRPGRSLRVQQLDGISRRRSMDESPVSCTSVRRLIEGPLSHLSLPLQTIVPRASLRGGMAEVNASAWGTRLPCRAFLEVGNDVFVSTPEFAFVQMASRLDVVDLVELGCELCGTYTCGMGLGGTLPTSYDLLALTDVGRLRRCIDELGGARGVKRARAALPYVAEGSGSPMETRILLPMALPGRLGGYGLGTPLPNHVVEASAEARAMAGRSFFRCDLFLPQGNLDVEYNGLQFHGGQRDMERDARRANALLSMGITVLTVTADQLRSERGVDTLMCSVARRAGVRVRSRARDVERRRHDLLARLFGHLWWRGGQALAGDRSGEPPPALDCCVPAGRLRLRNAAWAGAGAPSPGALDGPGRALA